MKEKLTNVFCDKFIMEPHDVVFDKPFKEYDIDSLDFTEFLLFIEDEFNVEINDNDANNLKTLNDVMEYLKKDAYCSRMFP
jgi:acyl carrier protein